MLYKNASINLYMGTAADLLYQDYYKNLAVTSSSIGQHAPFNKLTSSLGISRLFFLSQIHSVHGICVDATTDIVPFAHEGDFLITNNPDIGIGVMTADCLPLILYDPVKKVVAAAHAGWKGAQQNIAGIVVQEMCQNYTCSPDTLQAILAPAARACCYEVTVEFLDHFKAYIHDAGVFQHRNDKLYFDCSRVNVLQLQEAGVSAGAIVQDYNQCTVCTTSYCSYRRQSKDSSSRPARQMTVVSLNL